MIVGNLVNQAKDGKTAVYNGLIELRENGYYEKAPVRSEDGQRIDHWESTVFELPGAAHSLLPGFLEIDKPDKGVVPELPQTGKPENRAACLLPGFQEIDNQDIGNLHLENRERSNNDFKRLRAYPYINKHNRTTYTVKKAVDMRDTK